MIKYYVARQTVKAALDAIDFCNKKEVTSCEVYFGMKPYILRKLKHKDAKFDYKNLDNWFDKRVIFNGAKIYKTLSEDLWIYFPEINELWSIYRKVGATLGK